MAHKFRERSGIDASGRTRYDSYMRTIELMDLQMKINRMMASWRLEYLQIAKFARR